MITWPVPSINSSALKYLKIFIWPGTLSSYDDFTEMGWKNTSLDLQASPTTDPRKSRASATAGSVEPFKPKTAIDLL